MRVGHHMRRAAAGAGGGPILPTAYDPATISPHGNITFTNSNKTAEAISTAGAWRSVWSDNPIDPTTTDLDFEVYIDLVGGLGNMGSGIGPDAGVDVPWAAGNNNVAWIKNGLFQLNGSTVYTASTYTTGDTIRIRVSGGSIYLWKNGTAENGGAAVYTGFNYANTRIFSSFFRVGDKVTLTIL